jgi:hypothetical protein
MLSHEHDVNVSPQLLYKSYTPNKRLYRRYLWLILCTWRTPHKWLFLILLYICMHALTLEVHTFYPNLAFSFTSCKYSLERWSANILAGTFPPINTTTRRFNHHPQSTYLIILHLEENIPYLSTRFNGAVYGSVYIEKPSSYPFFTLPISRKKTIWSTRIYLCLQSYQKRCLFPQL